MKALTTLPHHTFSHVTPHHANEKEMIAIGSWMLTLLLVAAAYLSGIQIIGPALQKLYQMFIQNNVLGF